MQYTTLISAADLAQASPDSHWVILDCRHDLTNPAAGRVAYDAGHIPTAQFAHLDTDLSDKTPAPDGKFRGRHPLPSTETFAERLRCWGVSNQTQVVAYDAQGGMFAARLWWMLRWMGHPQVAVLDGGLPAWGALGLPLATLSPPLPRGDFSIRPSLVRTVSAADIEAEILADARPCGAPRSQIIDARAPDRFRGENETLDPVGGHIPGAKNRFFKENLQADGRFKPPGQLRTELAALATPAENTVMQCGSGVTACHNLLAMEIAGLPGAALYPGSWSEWCSDPARPVAVGD